VGLGAVLHDRDAELHQRVEVGRLAVEVDGQDRLRPRRQPPLHLRRIERIRHGIDVREDGPRPGALDPDDRRHAGVRSRDHLVAGLDARRKERDRDRIGARRDADGMGGPAGLRERGLEALDLRREDVGAALEDACDLRVELRAQRFRLAREVEERDLHQYCSPCSR
jgi:hypothetical protein